MQKEDFEKILQHAKEELNTIRTGGANPALVEGVLVEAYGSRMRLQELASIHAPQAQLLLIQPWDTSVVKNIESALRESDLGLQPVIDGNGIRIAFPPLTEEKRKEFVKRMHEKIEDARIRVRQVREEWMHDLKEQEKSGALSEDALFKEEKQVQKIVDEYNSALKLLAETKEKELLML